ncbi:MAG: glutamate--cysteine ligase [Candidatus Marinimicrobia bacterium]|nr:glutamate--cysteine ligase [Candidatus Neomarinimicrobiota bacterium]
MQKERIYFNNSPDPTIGVEVELFVLDADTLELAPGAPTILNNFPDSLHVKEELLDSIVEVNTKICRDVSEVREDLRTRFCEVIKVAEDNGFQLMGMGMHPRARWIDQTITDKERYLQLVDKLQWPVRRLLISGVHVHVGVDSGEKAIAITNGLTRYIPHMIGLSANTPFEYGELTGLASTRTKLFDSMPTTGIPPEMINYSQFQKFMRTLIRAKSISSIREVWWDIRPHPGFGTVEIRVYDCVSSLEEIVNLAAFTQALVTGLSNHYDDGSQLPILDRWVIKDNKWRATRYGSDADYIVDVMGNQQTLKSVILDTIDKILPVGKDLGCGTELLNLAYQVENDNAPYKRQIRLYEKTHDLNSVISNAVHALKESIGY